MASKFVGKRRKKMPRRVCLEYSLRHGTCRKGDGCPYGHVSASIVESPYISYVDVPDYLPLGVAVGKYGNVLRFIRDKVECLILPSGRNTREVEIVARTGLENTLAKDILLRMWGQLYPMGPNYCFINTDGLKKVSAGQPLLKFCQYTGYLPPHFNYGLKRMTSYAICCQTLKTTSGPGSNVDATKMVESLERMSLDHARSPTDEARPSVDTVEGQSLMLDGLFGSKPSEPGSIDRATGIIAKSQARILREYETFMKERLEGALQWLETESKEKKLMEKLEGRFGKVLWSNVKDDVLREAKEGWDVEKFTKFVFNDGEDYRTFTTDVTTRDEVLRILEDEEEAVCCGDLETFDFKITGGLADRGRNQLDVRLKFESGLPKVLLVKRNECKILILDTLCLHRKHDMRLCLSYSETVDESNSNYAIVEELLATMSYTDKPSPELKFTPVTDKWNVRYVRHKMKTTYSYQGKYFITASKVDSKRVYWEDKECKNKLTMFTPQDYDECHEEVEFHNIQWICTFGRQVGFSPEQALVLDLQDPAAFLASAPASLRPPSATEDRAPADGCPAASANPPPTAGAARGCWHVDTIVADYDAFVQDMEDLNECLGNVDLES